MLAELDAAVTGGGGALAAADRLCAACVRLLGVDGASVSLVHDGSSRGTFGSTGPLSRELDELQFTYGEGPCLDAVSRGGLVHSPDLADPAEQRWPVLRSGLLERGIAAVFAVPVTLSAARIGALTLFRHAHGPLGDAEAAGAAQAARLANLPLLDLMADSAGHDADSDDVDSDDADADGRAATRSAGGAGGGSSGQTAAAQLQSLHRVEVYQATGMLMAAWDVDAAQALARLRAHAFALGMTASGLASAVVERRVLMTEDGWAAQPQDGREANGWSR